MIDTPMMDTSGHYCRHLRREGVDGGPFKSPVRLAVADSHFRLARSMGIALQMFAPTSGRQLFWLNLTESMPPQTNTRGSADHSSRVLALFLDIITVPQESCLPMLKWARVIFQPPKHEKTEWACVETNPWVRNQKDEVFAGVPPVSK